MDGSLTYEWFIWIVPNKKPLVLVFLFVGGRIPVVEDFCEKNFMNDADIFSRSCLVYRRRSHEYEFVCVQG